MEEVLICCKYCNKTFIQNPSRKTHVYCSKNCGVFWRTKNVYNHRYTVAHRGRSVENFLKALRTKKSERRHLKLEFLLDLYNKQQGLCAVSGYQMTYLCGQGSVETNISIDRIDSSLGYEEGNIQLVCLRVNRMKSDKNIENLLAWCKKIINHNPRDNRPSNLRIVSKKVNRTKQPKRG